MTIIGSISGVRPTATATEKKKASFRTSKFLPSKIGRLQSSFVPALIRNTVGVMTMMKRIISQVN